MGVVKKIKTIVWTAWADGDLEADLTTTVLYNNTGRVLSWNEIDARFELSGITTQNYIITIVQSEYGTTGYGKVPISDNKIGLRFEEGIFGIQSVSGTVDYPLTIKIEIYE